jgi:hypothetical protein
LLKVYDVVFSHSLNGFFLLAQKLIFTVFKRITLVTSYLSADESRIKVLDETMDGSWVCGIANLFSESNEASERAAMIYYLLATCRLHDIDPLQWLKDISETLPQIKINDIESLLPQNRKQLPHP